MDPVGHKVGPIMLKQVSVSLQLIFVVTMQSRERLEWWFQIWATYLVILGYNVILRITLDELQKYSIQGLQTV